MYEFGFSVLIGIKKKQSSLVDVEPHLHFKLTNIKPDIPPLLSGHKQFHS
jgi:hypothetical protein